MSEQDLEPAGPEHVGASGDRDQPVPPEIPPRTDQEGGPDLYADSTQLTDPARLMDADGESANGESMPLAPWTRGVAFKGAPPPLVAPPLPWFQRRKLQLAEATARSPGIDVGEQIISAVVIVGITVFLVWQLRPDLLFGPNMDVGGDNGGHVAAPYFLIHHLLNHGRITGWDPWWFDGFPLYVFYFPLPALLVGLLNTVFPYAVAFKLVTVLGTVTLPLCAWAFGCLAGFRRPTPVLMAAAMLPYLFNTSYTIDGGNITSTMAGEFSFSLALSFGMLFLGVFMYSLRTGRLRWLAAIFFAATVLCHIVPAFAFAGVAILLALSMSRLSALKVLIPVGIVGGLLAAFWLIPFGVENQYSASMGYQRVAGLWVNLVPRGSPWLLWPAVVGMVIAVVRFDRFASVLALSAAVSGLAFGYLPSGAIYNGRWLPFWFLFVALVAAYGVAQLFRGVAFLCASPWFSSVGTVVGTIVCFAGAAQAGGLTGAFPDIHPVGSQIQVQDWVNWNYSGFQGKTGWPQFQGMISMMDRAGQKYGCGRLQYEYISETTNPFGSTEAMMAIPLWTNGCMEATDGIYFESSTTTPFHFLDVSEVSQNGESPDPVSNLQYPGFNLPDGIRHLQFMGVRYFFAMSPPVEAAAAVDPSLVKIGQTPGFAGTVNGVADPHPVWQLYLIKNAPIVSPLAYDPVVESSGPASWLATNLSWYEKEQYWPVELVRDGPPSWQHAEAGRLVPPSDAVPARGTTVSHVIQTYSSISFDVTTLGSPVVVKIPYFPNWQATGARGPYEASPNVMVVVPTSHHVTLTYGTTTVDWVGKAASVVGLGGLGALIFRPRVDVGPDPAASDSGPVTTASEPVARTDPTSTAAFDPLSGADDRAEEGVSDEDDPGEAPPGSEDGLDHEDRPNEDGPAEDGPDEDGPDEDGPAEDGPDEDGPDEDGPAERVTL